MAVYSLLELKKYTLEDLEKLFNKDAFTVKKIIKSLIYRNIVKKITNQDVKLNEDIMDFDSESKIEEAEKNTTYSFEFVGLLTIDDIYLAVYPKYVYDYQEDRNNNYSKFKQILLVIEKNRHLKQLDYEYAEESLQTNLFSLIQYLFNDYHEYGLYSNHSLYNEINGKGPIDWNETIDNQNALLVNDVPVYLDVHTQNMRNNENDFFQLLHSIILSDSSTRYSGLLNILGMSEIMLTTEVLEDLGTSEYLIDRLTKELSTQFVTRKQISIKMMRNYIHTQSKAHSSNVVLLIGVKKFENIWEDVCSVVMNNSLDQELSLLGLTHSIDKDKKLKDVIEKPTWKREDSNYNFSYDAQKTLQPDIVTLHDNQMYIYDAKYYKIYHDQEKFYNHPGAPDVTKQKLYELAYTQFNTRNNIEFISNAFLFPSNKEEEESIGSVDIGFIGENLKEIQLIMKPCTQMYSRYLNS